MQRRRLISAASSVLQYVRGGDTMACALQAALPQAVLRGAGAEPSAPCGNRPRGFLMRGHTPSRFSSVALQSGGAAELHPPQRTDTKRPAVLKFLDASGGETLVGAGDAAGPVAVVHSAASLETTLAEVWVVETKEQAEQAVRVLRHFRPVNQGVAYHAIDTEVSGIDLSEETPVGHGRIVCFSVYCGPDVDFTGDGTKKCLWVDVLKGGQAVLDVFKPYLEDASIQKVWHNYSFDKHIFENAGINPAGFACDTMHMARLWDSSRALKGYSLEALTSDDEVMYDAGEGFDVNRSKSAGLKELFGRPNLKKDGTEGKLLVLPDIEELQQDPASREKWIVYSARDAQATWYLRESLETKLRNMRAVSPRQYIVCNSGSGEFTMCQTMWEFYHKYWRPFGDLLVTMERHGMQVDKGQLQEAQVQAEKHRRENEDKFREWVQKLCPDAKYMNVASGTQIRQLLFAGFSPKGKRPPVKPRKKKVADPADEGEGDVTPASSESQPVVPYEKEFKYVTPEWEEWDRTGREGKAPKKNGVFVLHGICKSPIEVTESILTETKLPSTSIKTLRAMAGKATAAADVLKRWDAAEAAGDEEEKKKVHEAAINTCKILYNAFGGGRAGLEAAVAIDALCEAAAVETLLTNFIIPLQQDALRGPERRVHCSLNINTETGRLSARKPNLQNQPALEKDRYGIRKAFVCKPGNSLIVADYGQLELRLLAHMANCTSMLTAFKEGGDFHSRTAMGMYPYIREAVDAGKCLLEFDGPEDKAPVPLLKNEFAVERRKAKILNFSIAYGKTKHGLSRDWGVTLDEAEKTVKAWYADRPEVKTWQAEQHQHAEQFGLVYTLLGRQRRLPDAVSDGVASSKAKQHALRAAINTPIQGGAADIAMLAMLELNMSAVLRDLGWKLLMQVHDEVILEGPVENADAALVEVRRAMGNPFNGKNLLRVELDVSARFAKSWYDAKG